MPPSQDRACDKNPRKWTTLFTQYCSNYQETRCSHLMISPMFSGPTSIFSKDSGQPSRKKVTQDSLQSVTLRTSRIISPKGRMPKIFVLNTMIHRRRERKQVDTTLQLKIQSCSNDITWNTVDGDWSWSFLQSWVPRTMIHYSQES